MNMMTRPPAKFKVKMKAAKSPKDRVYQFAEVSQAPDVAAVYDALFGESRPIDDLIAANQPMLRVMRSILQSDVKAHLRANPGPVSRQVIRVAVTAGSDASLSIPALRKAAKPFERVNLEFVATARFRAVPFAGDPTGVGLAAELEVLTMGEEVQRKFTARRRRVRTNLDVVGSPTERIDPEDSEAIDAAINRMFAWDSPDKQIEEFFADEPDPPTWTGSRNRGLRAYLPFMVGAQLPLKSMLIANDAGKIMMSHALGEANRLNGIACKAGPPAIHRDGIPHFLFKELRRLGLDNINVPLVMLR